MSKQKVMQKRVGAFVNPAIDNGYGPNGFPPVPINGPYPNGPMNNPYLNGPEEFGPNGCGYPNGPMNGFGPFPPPFPPVPVGAIRGPPGPPGPRGERGLTGLTGPTGPAGQNGRVEDVGVIATVLPLTSISPTVSPVQIASIGVSSGGATAVGSFITLPKVGKYQFNFTITVTQTVAIGQVTLTPAGSSLGLPSTVATELLAINEPSTLSGSFVIYAPIANTTVGLNIMTSAGTVTVPANSGAMSAQLLA